MPLFFNFKGLVFGLLAAIPVVGVVTAWPETSAVAQNSLFAGTLGTLDLAYRFAFLKRDGLQQPLLQRDVGEWWLTTNRGGSIMFLPAWLFGPALLLVVYVVF